eukprot:jgi/Bigna1/86954/estExt_fgenesh1_pg.C_150161
MPGVGTEGGNEKNRVKFQPMEAGDLGEDEEDYDEPGNDEEQENYDEPGNDEEPENDDEPGNDETEPGNLGDGNEGEVPHYGRRETLSLHSIRQTTMLDGGARAQKMKLFEFFTAENGLESKKSLTKIEFEHVLEKLIMQLKLPKSPYVKTIFRKFALGSVPKNIKAKMAVSVIESLRGAVPRTMSKIDASQFKAVLEDLTFKVFKKLSTDAKKLSSDIAAVLSSFMMCGGYSEIIFKYSLRKLTTDTIDRKTFTNFIINAMLRFKCPFPSKYSVTRALRFLALAIVDETVIQKVLKYTRLEKQKPKLFRRKSKFLKASGGGGSTTTQSTQGAVSELYGRLLDSKIERKNSKKAYIGAAKGRMPKKWFTDMIKANPFEDLVVEGIMASWHKYTPTGKLNAAGFADILEEIIKSTFTRITSGRKDKELDDIDMDAIITLLTGTKPTQTQQHLCDFYKSEKLAAAQVRLEQNTKGGSEAGRKGKKNRRKNDKGRQQIEGKEGDSGLTLEQFGKFMARAWKHEADCGEPARAHARYLGALFLLSFEDSAVISMEQERLELEESGKLEEKRKKYSVDDEDPNSEGKDGKGKDSGDWRKFEYGLDLEFSDGENSEGESTDEEEAALQEDAEVEQELQAQPKAKQAPRRKKKKKKKKKKRRYEWNERHWVLPSKNDRQVSSPFKSSFDSQKIHSVRADGSSYINPTKMNRTGLMRLPRLRGLVKSYGYKPTKANAQQNLGSSASCRLPVIEEPRKHSAGTR